jgi:hypothetical protein
LGTIDYIAGAGHVDDCTGAQLYLQILANAIGIGFEGLARSYTDRRLELWCRCSLALTRHFFLWVKNLGSRAVNVSILPQVL